MKKLLSFIFVLTLTVVFLGQQACKKENLFRSEAEVKKSLQGTWNLFAIPKNDTIWNAGHTTYTLVEHIENWTFNDYQVTINLETQNVTLTSSFTVHTSATKAEIKIEDVHSTLYERYNGTWQIVRLDDNFLAIANDKEGSTGLLQLEFAKKK